MELTMTEHRPVYLPAFYSDAKRALAACASLDEVRNWSNKATALIAYARMAQDDEVMIYAVKIRARALRRLGELLLEVEPQPGARTDLEPEDAGVPRLRTRKQAAEDARIPDRLSKNAIRIASIPEPQFQQLVEDAQVRTIEALAKHGRTQRKPVEPEGELSAEHWMDRCEALQLSFAAAVDRAHDAIDQLSALDSRPRPAGAHFLLSPDFCAAVDRMRAMVSFLETAMRRATTTCSYTQTQSDQSHDGAAR
jgi:hypothetical protein